MSGPAAPAITLSAKDYHAVQNLRCYGMCKLQGPCFGCGTNTDVKFAHWLKRIVSPAYYVCESPKCVSLARVKECLDNVSRENFLIDRHTLIGNTTFCF